MKLQKKIYTYPVRMNKQKRTWHRRIPCKIANTEFPSTRELKTRSIAKSGGFYFKSWKRIFTEVNIQHKLVGS